MKKIMFLTLGMVLLLATSCLKSEMSKQSTSAPYSGVCVVEKDGEAFVTNESAKIEIAIPNASEKVLDITFYQLKFTPGMPAQDITIPGVQFTQSISADGPILNAVFDQANVIPTVGGTQFEQYKIKRVWGEIGATVTICFELQNFPYKVVFTTGEYENVPTFTSYQGKCVVEKDGVASVINESAKIEIKRVSNKMYITLYQLQFTPGMPAQDITLPGIEFTVEKGDSGDKKSIFDQVDVVPTIGDKPFEQYKIKRVWGEIGATVTICFELQNLPYKVTFTTDNIE